MQVQVEQQQLADVAQPEVRRLVATVELPLSILNAGPAERSAILGRELARVRRQIQEELVLLLNPTYADCPRPDDPQRSR